MLGSKLWNKITQMQVATGDIPSSGSGSGGGTGSGASSQDIKNIKSDIANIKSNLNNVYTKEEADSLVADVKSDIGNVYTKDEADSLIDSVKSGLDNVYTKAESDSFIADVKSDIGNVYTKDEADTIINGIKSDLGDVCGRGEVETIVAAETAKLIADAPDSLNTLKEIADWIDGHHESASAMNSAIAENTSCITDLQETQSSKMDCDDIRIISEEKYNALPDDQKTAEFYFITNGPVE